MTWRVLGNRLCGESTSAVLHAVCASHFMEEVICWFSRENVERPYISAKTSR